VKIPRLILAGRASAPDEQDRVAGSSDASWAAMEMENITQTPPPNGVCVVAIVAARSVHSHRILAWFASRHWNLNRGFVTASAHIGSIRFGPI
jgi:hypothetical protein